MYWLLSRRSQLSTENKLLLYKAILRPVWAYGIQLWGTTSNSNIEILQRFQSKTLRTILDVPWYINNAMIHSDLQMKTVRQVIEEYSQAYLKRLDSHANHLAVNLLNNSDHLYIMKQKQMKYFQI